MTHKVEVNRWAIRVRCERSASMRTACSDLDCCLTCLEGHCRRPDSKAQLVVGFGFKILATLAVRGERWKAFMKSMHTPFPKDGKLVTIMSSNSFHWQLRVNYENLSGVDCTLPFLKFTLMMLGKRALRSHLAEKWKACEKTFEPTA